MLQVASCQMLLHVMLHVACCMHVSCMLHVELHVELSCISKSQGRVVMQSLVTSQVTNSS
jgi:hypothetical protein